MACFGVYDGVQGQKSVKNKLKIADLALQIPEMESDILVCILTSFGIYDGV